MKLLSTLFLTFVTIAVFAGQTFVSEKAGFQITFPTDYDEEVDETDNMTSLSVTCITGDMMYFVSAFIYKEEIPKEQYATKIAEGIIITADSFNSKFKKKKLTVWDVSDEIKGLSNVIKGKLYNESGKMKIYGMMNICMANNIEYRVSAFSTKKRNFDESTFQTYLNSFKVLN